MCKSQHQPAMLKQHECNCSLSREVRADRVLMNIINWYPPGTAHTFECDDAHPENKYLLKCNPRSPENCTSEGAGANTTLIVVIVSLVILGILIFFLAKMKKRVNELQAEIKKLETKVKDPTEEQKGLTREEENEGALQLNHQQA